jgi:hypothetical protein
MMPVADAWCLQELLQALMFIAGQRSLTLATASHGQQVTRGFIV